MKIRTTPHYQHSLNRLRWLQQPICSGQYRDWLISPSSLTARLKLRYADFRVKPLAVMHAKANLDERTCLSLKQHQQALVREVLLYGNQKAVVFAHSVIPKQSLRGDWCALGRLGNKPLGEALFNNPKVKRTPLRFKRLSQRHALYQQALLHLDEAPTFLWARRSIFSLGCANILVTEVFLPEIQA